MQLHRGGTKHCSKETSPGGNEYPPITLPEKEYESGWKGTADLIFLRSRVIISLRYAVNINE